MGKIQNNSYSNSDEIPESNEEWVNRVNTDKKTQNAIKKDWKWQKTIEGAKTKQNHKDEKNNSMWKLTKNQKRTKQDKYENKTNITEDNRNRSIEDNMRSREDNRRSKETIYI